MFKPIRVRRLSTGTIYKLVAVGLACSLVPLSILFGVAALFGANTVTWNGQHLTGVTGLIASPLIGLFTAAIATLLLGSACGLGLWLYSLVRPITIVVRYHALEGQRIEQQG